MSNQNSIEVKVVRSKEKNFIVYTPFSHAFVEEAKDANARYNHEKRFWVWPGADEASLRGALAEIFGDDAKREKAEQFGDVIITFKNCRFDSDGVFAFGQRVAWKSFGNIIKAGNFAFVGGSARFAHAGKHGFSVQAGTQIRLSNVPLRLVEFARQQEWCAECSIAGAAEVLGCATALIAEAAQRATPVADGAAELARLAEIDAQLARLQAEREALDKKLRAMRFAQPGEPTHDAETLAMCAAVARASMIG